VQKFNSATSAAAIKKGSLASARNVRSTSTRGSSVKLVSTKPAPAIPRHDSTMQKNNVPPPKVPTTFHVPNAVPALAPCSNFVSPGRSGDSASVDETMSTCDSMKSPDFEYIDNEDSMLDSLRRRANEQLHISEDRNVEGLLKFLLGRVFSCVAC
jgi:cyclin-A